MMTSYAGNFEDVLLMRLFGDIETGNFVDIGACHARNGNCSWVFYQKGWTGVNVEPGPLFKSLLALRPRDLNLNVAVSDNDGTATLYFHEESPATSTLDPDLAPELSDLVHSRRPIEVETITLDTLRKRYLGKQEVEFLKIDVEGHETAVFRGCDWREFRPRVIVAEATRPFTNTPIHEEWSAQLTKQGYRLTLFDGVNVWLVREEDPELASRASLPVNQLDFFRPYDDEKTKALSELKRLRARLADIESTEASELNRLQKKLVDMEASTSWRITSPLRSLARTLKSTRE
jgi:FkbM family methyltransferase